MASIDSLRPLPEQYGVYPPPPPTQPLQEKYSDLVNLHQWCKDTHFPRLTSLVKKYRKREYNPDLRNVYKVVVGGYEREEKKDTKRLLLVTEKYLERFDSYNDLLHPGDCGLALTCRVEDKVYVRADIHGDLLTTLSLFEHLQELGLLDKHYICSPGVKIFFLGDYTDRGANDMEVLTLLLLLKIKNPYSIFLLQGNHEDTGMQRRDSIDGKHFSLWSSVFWPVYSTLPVGMICEGSGGRIYVAHGGFPTATDLNSCHTWKAIPTHPVVQEFQSRTGTSPKQQHAIETLQRLPVEALHGNMTTWGDVGETCGPSSDRGKGYIVDGEVIWSALRANNLKAMIRGHQHVYKELVVNGKIICTTLPMATGGSGTQENQGILLEPDGKVGAWKKWIDHAHGTGPGLRFTLDDRPRRMYESCLI